MAKLRAYSSLLVTDDADSGEGHKWGLLALLRHLREKGIDTDAIWEDICDIVIKTLLSVEAHINSGVKWNCKRQDVCHELFGFVSGRVRTAKPPA